jgi:hypothetical protein
MNFNFSPAFQSWINEGTRPASAQSLSSLLDESRSALKSIIDRIESGQIKMASPIENAVRQYAEIKPNITPAKRPIYNRTPQASAPKPAPQVSNRFAGAHEGLVVQAATHRFSPEADKLEARQELQSRGFTVTPEGIVSRSTRGGRAVRLSK